MSNCSPWTWSDSAKLHILILLNLNYAKCISRQVRFGSLTFEKKMQVKKKKDIQVVQLNTKCFLLNYLIKVLFSFVNSVSDH